MSNKPEYYEFYGELIKSNIFLKRLVIFLVVVNIVLAYVGYLGFTRPVETYVVKDGYAYATEPAKETRSVHEVRRFTVEFAKNFLEYNRENFNAHFRAAMKMCTSELEYFMFDAIKNSDIPKIVQNTSGNIQFEIADIQIRAASDFEASVTGRQIFPGASSIPIKFTLQITIVPRTQDNPFGLRIINYTQEKA
ncbi:MAG: hypothetical protein ONB46_01565 [candidate division KSB1 bacterium]|nr:hypothetical protein [candidate division KSB1 bacterium]MDZ7364354.1 hypothetical protein [candidate division KSB1 bacterium]MDZ7402726.1 hypothetical protein [candidate division KSB1 bacterium]